MFPLRKKIAVCDVFFLPLRRNSLREISGKRPLYIQLYIVLKLTFPFAMVLDICSGDHVALRFSFIAV